MEKKTFEVKGMSCAACAAKVERSVNKLEGVSSVNVMLLKNRMTLIADPARIDDAAIIAAVRNAGYDACAASSATRVKTADDSEVRARRMQLAASFVLLLILMLVSMGADFNLVLIPDMLVSGTVQLVLALSIMLLQRRYFISAFRALKHFGSNMDTLVSMGSLVSFIYSVYHLSMIAPGSTMESMGGHHTLYFETAAAILTFVAIGKYFEERTKVRTTDAVMMLYDLAPKFVTLKQDGVETQIPLSEVQKGQVLLVRAGEQLGVDGCVLSGSGYCDESSLTGESRPVKKTAGAQVVSASVLTSGELEVRADAVGQDTTLSKIIALVDDATSKKAPIARLADLIAGIFVPAVIAIAAVTFAVWYFVLDAAFGTALNFAVSVLVVSCPCALGLATPLAIVAGTGRAAKAGILFKAPEVIENLRKATVYVFDKTGTLTSGHMSVSAERFIPAADPVEIRKVLAALEHKSSHPLAQAVVRRFGSGSANVTDFTAHEGAGITGTVNGRRYGVGNRRMLELMGAQSDPEIAAFAAIHEDAGSTVLHVVREGQELGVIVISDELKPSAKATVAALNRLGILPLMLTGDSDKVAQSVARELKIRDYRAELMPQDKAAIIRSLQESGQNVVMIGDGVNDSVALATADTGIGLAGTSDIAVSSCGVVLLKGNLSDSVNAQLISRATMRNIRQNLFWAFIYNMICIPVAAGVFSKFGWQLTPMIGAVLMSLSSVCVGLNALRLTVLKLNESISDRKEQAMSKKVLSVEGMMCQHCVASVTKALKAVPGVMEVAVSLEQKTAEVSFEGSVDDGALKQAVVDAGYEVKGMHD